MNATETAIFTRRLELELPDGWAAVALGDACEKITDGTHKTPTYQKNGVPFISTANLVPFKKSFDFSGYSRFISDEEHRELTKRCRPEKGDVLISKCGTIGRAKEVDVNYEFSIFVGLALLKPDKELFAPHYLEVLLNAPDLQNTFSDLAPGSTRRTLTLAAIKTVEIPIPPLAEQKRIVEKVEQLLAHVNAARERLARVPVILKRFRQAVLAAACSGQLTADWRDGKAHNLVPVSNALDRVLAERRRSLGKKYEEPAPPDNNELGELPELWCWASVEQLASSLPRSIQSGPFGSHLHHSEFQDTGVLAIGIDNVLEGQFSLGKQHRISEAKFESLRKFSARPRDVLITVMATVGRCCVVPEDIEHSIITKHVYRITGDPNLIEPLYLMSALRGSPTVIAQIQSQIRGQTRPGINGQILKRTTIPVPPMAEQQEIVRRVNALFVLADAIEKRVAAAATRAEKLTQAILAKAFRGELVPTEAELARREGRSYEPASALLDRIREERPHAVEREEPKKVFRPAVQGTKHAGKKK
jgi:restriction endonuclease S subunit